VLVLVESTPLNGVGSTKIDTFACIGSRAQIRDNFNSAPCFLRPAPLLLDLSLSFPLNLSGLLRSPPKVVVLAHSLISLYQYCSELLDVQRVLQVPKLSEAPIAIGPPPSPFWVPCQPARFCSTFLGSRMSNLVKFWKTLKGSSNMANFL
jgi:hypothetical protein